MKNYIEALKRRKEETGESGFSLIELIVVVVILGVLAAIAIPVFSSIQDNASTNAAKTVAANGASQVAAAIANKETVTSPLTNLQQDGFAVTISKPADLATVSLTNYCVTAAKDGKTQTSGPGC